MLSGLRRAARKILGRSDRAGKHYLWLQTCGIRTVLDVGANVGRFAAKMRAVLPDAKIYAFEPLAECYGGLTQRFAGDVNVEVLNFALGECEGSTTIHHSTHSPASSLLEMSSLHKRLYPHTVDGRQETIIVRPLDSVAGELAITPNMLIKVDVQGYEDRVIRGGAETFSRADVVLMETCFQKLFDGQLLFDDLYDLLRPMGFSFRGFLRPGRTDSNGRLVFADSVFIK